MWFSIQNIKIKFKYFPHIQCIYKTLILILLGFECIDFCVNNSSFYKSTIHNACVDSIYNAYIKIIQNFRYRFVFEYTTFELTKIWVINNISLIHVMFIVFLLCWIEVMWYESKDEVTLSDGFYSSHNLGSFENTIETEIMNTVPFIAWTMICRLHN